MTRSNFAPGAALAALICVTATVAGLGCANLDRSRDLANPKVSATTLAQQVCSNCHGLTGQAVSPNFPILAAQVESYVVAQLKEFRSKSRHDPAGFEYMWGLSRSLTDEQINGLGAYYAAQRPAPQRPEGDPARIADGRAIFNGGVPGKSIPACASCHGPKGEGNATFPRLAGQHADYLVKQLVVFQRSGERPDSGIMKTVAHDLTRRNIDDVAAFIQAMPGL